MSPKAWRSISALFFLRVECNAGFLVGYFPLGGRDVGVGVKNYGSTIQFAAMYYLKAEPSPVFF